MPTPIKTIPLGEKYSSFVVEKPGRTLAFFLLIVMILIPGGALIKSRYSPRVWYPDDHQVIQHLNRFEKKFGSDQNLVLGIEAPSGIFTPKTIKLIETLTDKFWEIPEIIRVESITNFNIIAGEDDDILINPLVPEEQQLDEQGANSIKERALSHRVIPNTLVAKDGKFAFIVGKLRPAFEKDPNYQEIVLAARKIIKKYENSGDIKLSLMGDAAANNSFREISNQDNWKILPFMFGFIILLIFLLYKSAWAVILALGLIGSTIGSTIGLIGHTGIVYNSLLAAIPGVLLAICLADAVHILTSFFYFRSLHEEPKQAIRSSLIKNFVPTLLTSVSTAISFFSITVSEIRPVRDLGILCGIGTMLAWLLTYGLLGALISLLSSKFSKPWKGKLFSDQSDRKSFSVGFSEFINSHKGKIIILFLIFSGGSGWLALQGEVNSDPIKYFHTSVPIRQAYEGAYRKMDGLRGIEMVVDSGVDEGIKNPDFLRQVDKYSKFITSISEISKVRSIIDVIKEMNQVLKGGNPEFYRLPMSKGEIGEDLLLYSMGLPQGMDINDQYSLEGRYLRMRVIWKLETSKESEAMAIKLVKIAKEKFNLNVETGGNVPLYITMNTKIVSSFFRSMGMALVLVSFLLLLLFKDLFISLFSMLPNIIPLLFGGALMTVMGQYIDIGTSIVYTVCLGIAVDDTIHFVSSYRSLIKQGQAPIIAIQNVLNVTGKALIITTMLLVAGFGTFIFADFVPNRNFGFLCSLILAIALLTDLLFLPALLLYLDEKSSGKKKVSCN